MTYRDDAKAAKAGKVSRILGGANRSNSDAVMASEGARGTPPVTKAIDRGTTKVKGGEAKKRLDKPERARGGSVKKGKTNVTVVVAPQGGASAPGVSVAGVPPTAAPPMPVTAPAGPVGGPGPAMPPAMPPRLPMGAPPAGMPMRKRGGPVNMKGGAGGGLGRLEKAAQA